MAEFDRTPVKVPLVETTIRTALPVPESLPIFERSSGPSRARCGGSRRSSGTSAEGFTVADRWGNRWIDWSSGVLIANAGHGRPEIRAALKAVIDQGLLATYVFVHEKRAELTGMLQALAPDPADYQVFLLSTGQRGHGELHQAGQDLRAGEARARKRVFVSFDNAFHGRTMGAQLAGGMAEAEARGSAAAAPTSSRSRSRTATRTRTPRSTSSSSAR
jgi:4-aminobutyrate aminotransferase / (S)-3-amino-2-methylpropionate transaminase / 5-aminovalerate transaminase